MKFSSTSSFLVLLSTVVAGVFGEEGAPAAMIDSAAAVAVDEDHRDLQQRCESAGWHPIYSYGWDAGRCEYSTTCDSPVYETNLACCKAAFGSQSSGYCLTTLANPPTLAPTKTGGPDAYYPNYSPDWSMGTCTNAVPVPSGRPVFTTMLACCKASYGGQASNACIKALPNAPTMAPTKPGAAGADYYPNYDLAWSEGICINTKPIPSGRPVYATNIACCKAAYGGQVSNACIKALANPPTMAPTKPGAAGADYYPNYDLAWTEGVCINTKPVPSGRPVYATQIACCKAAYGGQTSNACIKGLLNPPTMAPTKPGAAGADYYPNYDLAWTEGVCINTKPVPSGRPVYATQIACCKGAYGGQASNACIKNLATPPTMAPTNPGAEGTDFYPNYDLPWTEGKCLNTKPVPSGRPVYATNLACCKGAYGGQASQVCIRSLLNPPTSAPTKPGGGSYYPDYSLAWSEGKCINTEPVPSGRPVYSSNLACCKSAYAGQVSKTCIKMLPFPPTMAPSKKS